MKNFIFALVLIVCSIEVSAKTTYIPTYYSNISIAAGSDTTYAHGITPFVGMVSQDGTVAISVIHEVVDEDKVKAIKKAKRAAGWATAAAVFSGLSAGLNPGRTPQDAMRYVNQIENTKVAAQLSSIAKDNAAATKVLTITFKIENLSDKEIAVADMARGLVWYVLPHQYLDLEAFNPDVAQLRISNTDPFHQDVKYVTIEAGSTVSKETVQYEDEQLIIFDDLQIIDGFKQLAGYNLLMKDSFQKVTYDIKEGKQLINAKKQAAKEAKKGEDEE